MKAQRQVLRSTVRCKNDKAGLYHSY